VAREIELLSDEQMLAWMASVRWIFAATMKAHPHHYCLKAEARDADLFERVVLTIWERGYDRSYLGRLWRSLDVGERRYVWFHTSPSEAAAIGLDALLSQTILINGAARTQERLL
jgi:hypothetical protein